jgi:DNA-directed RNA polymerase subunit RPC12/RpoP
MKLIDTVMCVECEEVFENSKEHPNSKCPSCGSKSLFQIPRMIMPMSVFERTKDGVFTTITIEPSLLMKGDK